MDVVITGIYLLSVIYIVINILRNAIRWLYRKIKDKNGENDDMKVTSEQSSNEENNDHVIKNPVSYTHL